MPYIILILVFSLMTSLTGGYLYVVDLSTKLDNQIRMNSALQLKAEQQQEAIESIQNDFALQTSQLNALSQKNREIEAEKERYLSIFKRHDLNKLAYAKPGLIEKRANKATKNVFDTIEQDTIDIDAADDGVSVQPASGKTGGS